MPNSALAGHRTPLRGLDEPGSLGLALLAASLMLLLAVATIVAVSLNAPLLVAAPLAAASLAVRPLAVLHRRRGR